MWLLVPFQKTKNNFWNNDVIRQVTWHVLKGLNTDQNRIQIDFTWNWPTALKSYTPLYNSCFKITIITRVEALLTDTCKWKAPLIILQPPSEGPFQLPYKLCIFTFLRQPRTLSGVTLYKIDVTLIRWHLKLNLICLWMLYYF